MIHPERTSSTLLPAQDADLRCPLSFVVLEMEFFLGDLPFLFGRVTLGARGSERAFTRSFDYFLIAVGKSRP